MTTNSREIKDLLYDLAGELVPTNQLKVVDVSMHEEEIEIHVELREKQLECGCGIEPMDIMAGEKRQVQDLPAYGRAVNFVVHLREIFCPDCGEAGVEDFEMGYVNNEVTDRLAQYVCDLYEEYDMNLISKHLDLSWRQVDHILLQDDELDQGTGNSLSRIGWDVVVDERNVENLIAIDHDTGRIMKMEHSSERISQRMLNWNREESGQEIVDLDRPMIPMVAHESMVDGFVVLSQEKYVVPENVIEGADLVEEFQTEFQQVSPVA